MMGGGGGGGGGIAIRGGNEKLQREFTMITRLTRNTMFNDY